MMEQFIQLAPTIGLLFFFTVFVGIAVWAMRPSMKAPLQALANIPLKED
ncbi:MAG: cbb3-type cytochrome c oxidase subunit 3 [Alphaproteobacteria bacterium]|nr:cbb3-type cytochrome c oxidase subunit 3 [Alphaproteobacteria bacterium]